MPSKRHKKYLDDGTLNPNYQPRLRDLGRTLPDGSPNPKYRIWRKKKTTDETALTNTVSETGADMVVRYWRVRLEESREDIVKSRGFGPFASAISDIECNDTEELKKRLMRRYKGKHLQDVIDGREMETETGKCFYLTSSCDMVTFDLQGSDIALNMISSDLKLVYGIGESIERSLKDDGYKTVFDLISHPRYGGAAREFVQVLESRDTLEITGWITSWYSLGNPLAFLVSAFHNLEDFVFLDIETLGLSHSVPLFLVGVARIAENKILIEQYLARSIAEEAAAISLALTHIKDGSAFVTYNGRLFDIPYLQARAAYYRLKTDLNRLNLDILYFARRAWRDYLPNCRLCSVESHILGVTRSNDVPGFYVPEFYNTYRRTKNPGPLVPIIEHNKQDLVSLVNIFLKLCEGWR